MSDAYDVIIIGGGPAGLTAGMYCARARLKTLLLEKAFTGGQIVNTERVENYPGFPDGISGFDLGMLMQQQAQKYGLQIVYAEVSSINNKSNYEKIVDTNEGSFVAKSLIIAGGAEHNHLDVPGEQEFVGRGVSYCATCDGAFYKDQDVAIVGGGDSAVVEAIALTRFASKVYLIHRRDALRASKIVQEQALSNPKIEFVWDTVVLAIEGDAKIEDLKISNVKTQKQTTLKVAAVFVSVGLHPNTAFVKDIVSLDKGGYIIANEKMETGVDGIYTAGDIRLNSVRQVIAAAGDGATAALNAERYLLES
ncbi:MAG: thioredoxin-disulfide reductase [Chloroflexi bacterium]|jgi:thioredoxin reductase (NADPH)|nr:thioredoxin-disulfide reductase [Chloroflexota bacterium]MBT7080366.1 thioredoxin-disulfide reductase [Chloroflexota bacterium]MBT7289804.1 thioredoxin-disulfide reductase [Chloroflexota bacterium]